MVFRLARIPSKTLKVLYITLITVKPKPVAPTIAATSVQFVILVFLEIFV